jgi:hypothetical protein
MLFFGGYDHGLTIGFIERHGLLTEDVNSRFGGSFRVGPMHVIRKSDVHRVDLAGVQTVGIPFVRIGVRNVILARKRSELLVVARNERSQFRILAGVRESGQHRDLRYVAQPDDCVPNLSLLPRGVPALSHETSEL